MKVKRYKHARKVLSFYKHTFGVHEPYQVLGKLHELAVVVSKTAAYQGRRQVGAWGWPPYFWHPCRIKICSLMYQGIVSYMSHVEALATGIKIGSSDQSPFRELIKVTSEPWKSNGQEPQLQFDPLNIERSRASEGNDQVYFLPVKNFDPATNASNRWHISDYPCLCTTCKEWSLLIIVAIVTVVSWVWVQGHKTYICVQSNSQDHVCSAVKKPKFNLLTPVAAMATVLMGVTTSCYVWRIVCIVYQCSGWHLLSGSTDR